MKNLFAAAALLVFISCKDSEQKTTSTDTSSSVTTVNQPTPNIPVNDLSGCYRMIMGKDTAYMELALHGDSLTGPLSYRRFEKDSNTGTVYLKKTAERAEGWYVFQSEGMTSVREIILHTSDSSFAEGYGEIEMKGDTAKFKYPHNIKFEDKHPFVRVPCK